MKYLLILVLLAQAPSPKPLPSPPYAVVKPDTEIEFLRQTGKALLPSPLPKGRFPFVAVDNGIVQLTIADGDMPVGPCDLGKLVRAARAYVDGTPISWEEPGFMAIKDGDALFLALQAELARCSPKKVTQ